MPLALEIWRLFFGFPSSWAMADAQEQARQNCNSHPALASAPTGARRKGWYKDVLPDRANGRVASAPEGGYRSNDMAVPPQEQRLQTVCLLILTTLAVALALYWLRSAMIPFVLALFFSYALAPFVDLQVRYLRIPSSLAVTATLVLGFFLLTSLAAVASASVSELTANAVSYQAQIERLPLYLDSLLRSWGIRPPEGFNPVAFIQPGNVGSMVISTTNAVLGLLSQGTLVMVFMFFLMAGRAVDPPPMTGVWGEIESSIKRYVVTKVVTSGATAVLVWLILTTLGVDLAAVFGLFAFLLNFIPNIGSVIATLLPLPVILFDPDLTSTTAVLAMVLPSIVQLAIGNLVEPRLMGTSLDLHPVAILLALVLWGAIWGIVGMLLATPITAVMKILVEKLDLTAPMGALMAGRFAPFPRAVPSPVRPEDQRKDAVG